MSKGTLAGLLGESERRASKREYFAEQGKKEVSQGYERECYQGRYSTRTSQGRWKTFCETRADPLRRLAFIASSTLFTSSRVRRPRSHSLSFSLSYSPRCTSPSNPLRESSTRADLNALLTPFPPHSSPLLSYSRTSTSNSVLDITRDCLSCIDNE